MQQLVDSFSPERGMITTPDAVVVIGASSGGPNALAQIVPKLPPSLRAAVVIVQQMRPGFTRLLAGHLNSISPTSVEETGNYRHLGAGSVLVTPGNCCISIDRPGNHDFRPYIAQIENVSESVDRMRSRIDDAMISAAAMFGERAFGVLLTGVGDDGRRGMAAIRERGGHTIAQDEASCIVYDMPRAAIDAGAVDYVLPLWSIADKIVEIVGVG